jgi:tRNA U54 and U55 pseudouridine synthase Pus10
MSNVIMSFNYSKNQILELLYQNINREIGKRDAERIIARIENESSRHQCNVKLWYELIELEVTRMFYTENEQYQRSTPYTKYFTVMFPQAAENVEWAVNTRWMQNLEK